MFLKTIDSSTRFKDSKNLKNSQILILLTSGHVLEYRIIFYLSLHDYLSPRFMHTFSKGNVM